jgi:allantoate deiminase
MRERAIRAIEECRKIATMSEEPGRITRRFLTPPMHAVHAHLRDRMESLGMTVHVDAAGNLHGLWQPRQGPGGKCLVLGSHIDTVPDAGAFDGVLGVVLALEWVEVAQEINTPFAIEVVAFSEEEGVRFGVPFLGSRAVAGRFDPALLALKDTEGITLKEAIRAFGLDPGDMEKAAMSVDALGFIEIHIEQGPVLDVENRGVACVTSIVGQTRLTMAFTGHANHAGTTPMRLRRDALAAAAEWITAVEKAALRIDGLVATVGKMTVKPNAANVIPQAVELSLDVRHIHDSTRRKAVEELLAEANAIADRRKLVFVSNKKMDEPAVPMDERLTSYLRDAMQAVGHPTKDMPSGAGHDAMVLASRMPTAMLFLQSPGGISHHPAEAVREEDVEAALLIGRKFLDRLGADVR